MTTVPSHRLGAQRPDRCMGHRPHHFAKPSAWGAQRPERCMGHRAYHCAKPAAWGSQPLPPLLGPKERPRPTPRPPPSPGRGLNRSHPFARSLRYPRPIKESRGDYLRNRVAIVCTGFARHSAKKLLNASCTILLFNSGSIFNRTQNVISNYASSKKAIINHLFSERFDCHNWMVFRI